MDADSHVNTWISRSPAETRRLAARFVRSRPGRTVLALHGELGSGKTCFVQGMARALNITAPVTSPTFTLINEYHGDRPLYHIDLYRVRTPQEALAMGFEEYLERDGVIAVEWAERAADLIPADAVHVTLEAESRPNCRRIAVSFPSPPDPPSS